MYSHYYSDWCDYVHVYYYCYVYVYYYYHYYCELYYSDYCVYDYDYYHSDVYVHLSCIVCMGFSCCHVFCVILYVFVVSSLYVSVYVLSHSFFFGVCCIYHLSCLWHYYVYVSCVRMLTIMIIIVCISWSCGMLFVVLSDSYDYA